MSPALEPIAIACRVGVVLTLTTSYAITGTIPAGDRQEYVRRDAGYTNWSRRRPQRSVVAPSASLICDRCPADLIAPGVKVWRVQDDA